MSYKTEFASNCVDFQTILNKINSLGKVIINFTISGTTYQADYQAYEGMTWFEWCNSSYNTDGFTCQGNTFAVYPAGDGPVGSVRESDSTEVLGSEVIISNMIYTISSSGGGGSSD